MQTDLLSISKIFTENLFRIPDYQRGYSWTEKQLKDFWNDVEQLEVGKNHYTGVLTLETVPASLCQRWDDDLWIIQSKKYAPFYVVDGQQRLTTVIILIQAILEKMADDEKLNYSTKEEIRKRFIFESRDGGISRSYLFGYEKDNPSYEFLKTKIFLERSDAHSIKEQTIYTHNLHNAKNFFVEQLSPMKHAELENIYARVTQNLLFNIYTISEDIDVFVAFETMNNRGKPLSHLELLKNRLIYLSTKFTVEQSEKNKLRSVINECWKTAYHYLGRNKNRPLSDDDFLKAHFLVYFGPGLFINVDVDEDGNPDHSLWEFVHDDHYKDYLLDEVFTSKCLQSPQEEGEGNSDLRLSINFLYKYSQAIKSSVQIYYSMFNPSDSDFSSEEKINLERLRRLGVDMPSVLLLALYQIENDAKLRGRILVLLECILFLRTISPYIPDLDRLNFDELGMQLSAFKRTAVDIEKLLKEYLGQALHKIKFASIFATWTKRSGYYGWRGVKYFMFEYELELLEKSKTNRGKLDWDEFNKESFDEDYRTVEHIYPQKVEDECWRVPFATYSVKERNVLKNCIGNLIPLSKPKNSSLKNKCFSSKKGDQSNKVGYVYGCYSEIEVAQSADWTSKEILARGIKLLEFMERRWGINLGSKQDKIKALGLQFVINKGLKAPE